MRVMNFTASLLLSGTMTMTGLTMASLALMTAPVRADAAPKSEFACKCPAPIQARIQARPAPVRQHARRIARSAVEGYSYGSAYAVNLGGWHGEWREARNDGYALQGPPTYYGPPPGYYDEPPGVQVDANGWTGGVGNYGGDDGGGGGGFTDGYGQVHFGNGGSAENGPTYNSYNQSFQYNPSAAGPFRARLQGGFAPPSSK